MGAWRYGVERGDLAGLLTGGLLVSVFALASTHSGAKIGVGAVFAVVAFIVLVTAWVLVPYVVVAISIPLFSVIPTAKVLVTPWIGPVKDIVTVAAAIAILINWRLLSRRVVRPSVDGVLMALVAAFVGLYVVNLGGDLVGGSHGIAWAQGLRLVAEPFILLVAGLTLRQPRRTLNVAVGSLIVTGLIVALYGIYQQQVGAARLVSYGYSYTREVRNIGGRLRSFGTLDDPFAYAALLLLAISAAVFWMRRGPLKTVLIAVLSIGVAVSYVRSAIVIAVALIAILLISFGRVTHGLLLLGVSVATALAFLVAVAGANETHSVRAGPNEYVTLNGRTTVWATVFAKPSRIPFGFGVGKVGTAAERAKFGVVADPTKAQQKTVAVDSGYFAVVADVGIVGLIIFLALITRLTVLGIAATKRAGRVGWLVVGWLAVLLLDAVTRASFTGFPTAFLGMLLVGLGLAAAAEPAPVPRRS
jgi:O-antigen ligase/polysaccharide polymerase Wzy-like membrane protein